MAIRRQKFASQATPALLAEMKAIAQSEGRQFQSILEEAMRDLIVRRRGARPRPHILDNLAGSLSQNAAFYERLNN